ncbi:MAG: polysaccharide deacetylase family protein [Nitrospirae bacterium]|nr:polysaccharide deacetylase family protein [Nitrospirota bacterium]
MKSRLVALLDDVDAALSGAYLRAFGERAALLTFLFHGIFRNEKEMKENLVDPQQGTTLEHFRDFIDYFLSRGYSFVGEKNLAEAPLPSGKLALITLDDGYFSSRHAQDPMNEFKVPAIFYLATGFVEENRCFWWDVVYRERIRRGSSLSTIRQEQAQLKESSPEKIRIYLSEQFGEKASHPIGEIDRPLTPREVRSMADDPLVAFGNHTRDHAILTRLLSDQAEHQIRIAQEQIEQWTGRAPQSVSYPNGDYSQEHIALARKLGFRFGLTVEPRKNYLPLDESNHNRMKLGRFYFFGGQRMRASWDLMRSEFRLRTFLRKAKDRLG